MTDCYIKGNVGDISFNGNDVTRSIGGINAYGIEDQQLIVQLDDCFVTLPFDSSEHKWIQAIADAIVARAAESDFAVRYIYLGFLGIKP